MTHFPCPHCLAPIMAAPEHAGRLVRCPSCGASAPVPPPTGRVPPPRKLFAFLAPLVWAVTAVVAVAAVVAAVPLLRGADTPGQALQQTRGLVFACLLTVSLYVLARALDRLSGS